MDAHRCRLFVSQPAVTSTEPGDEDENISGAAGAAHGQSVEPDDFAVLVAPLRRPLTQGTTLYQAATAHIATASRSLTWQSTRWPWRDGR